MTTERTEPPYNFCWECGRKLARVTRGKRKGQLAFRVVEVDGIKRYVHAECESATRETASWISVDWLP